jgi:hypothetical protein
MIGSGVPLLVVQGGVQAVNAALAPLNLPANIPFVLNAINQAVQLRMSILSGTAFGLPVAKHLAVQVQLMVGGNVLKTWRFELLGYNEAGQNRADQVGYGPFGPGGYFNSIATAWTQPFIGNNLRKSTFLQGLSNLTKQNLGVDFPVAWRAFNGAAEMFLRGSVRRAYGIYLSPTAGQGVVTQVGQVSALQLLQLVLSTVSIGSKASTTGFNVSNPGSMTTVAAPGIQVLFNPAGVYLQTGLGYDVLYRNSNTFVGTILRPAGLDNLVPQNLVNVSVGFRSNFLAWTTTDLALQNYISNQAKAAGL